MKGIILAGGSGTRLYPITEGISKQLMPIYDKPMIYYPLSTLMSAGIKDVLVITTEQDQDSFKRLLKEGQDFGINISYVVQPSPDGLAQAFILGEDFIKNDPCAMVLGDNIFAGAGLGRKYREAVKSADNGLATIFGIQVTDPERFGIMEIKDGKVISVEEKPKKPKSKWAITGLYFYPSGVPEKAKLVKPSPRGELEITTLNDMYLQEGRLNAELLEEGHQWFDTGTFDSQMRAANYVKSEEDQRDMLICCPEQIAYNNGWLTTEQLETRAKILSKNSYGQRLQKLINQK